MKGNNPFLAHGALDLWWSDDLARALGEAAALHVAIFSHEPLGSEVRRLGQELLELDARPATMDLEDIEVDLATGTVRYLGQIVDFDAAIMYHGAEGPEHGPARLADLARLQIPLVNDGPSVAVTMHKMRTFECFDRLGIPTPFTADLRSADDVHRAHRLLGGQLVLKDPISTEGRGVWASTSPQQTLQALYAQPPGRLIAQPMIEAESTDYRLMVTRTPSGTYELTTALRRTAGTRGEFRANVSLGGIAEPVSPHPLMVELAIEATRATGLDVAGVDIMVEVPSGRMFVVEVNSGPGNPEDYVDDNVFAPIAALAVARASRAAHGPQPASVHNLN